MIMTSEKTYNKWEKSGLLEGLSRLEQEKLAQLLNNQATYILLNHPECADTVTFINYTFSITRRLFQKLIEKYTHEFFEVTVMPCFFSEEKQKAYIVETYRLSSFPGVSKYDTDLSVHLSAQDREIDAVVLYVDTVFEEVCKYIDDFKSEKVVMYVPFFSEEESFIRMVGVK